MKNAPEQSGIPRAALVGMILASAVLYGVLAATPDLAGRPLRYLLVHGLLVALAGAALLLRRRLPGLGLLVAGAVVFRLVLVPAPPLLSPDVHRYLWDGEVAAAGVNPYARAPEDAALDPIASNHRPEVIYPELPTIYPPVAQAVFHGVVTVGGGLALWKLLLVGADVGILLLLIGWPGNRRRAATVLLYGWNPLVVVETAGSAHVEPLGVILALLGARAILAGSGPVTSMMAWTGSVLVKPFPLVTLPAYFRRAGWLASAGVAAGVTAVAYWPYRALGDGVLGSLGAYAQRWSFNSPVYELLREALERARMADFLKIGIARLNELTDHAPWAERLYYYVHPELVARVILGSFLAVIVVQAWRSRLPLVREVLVVSTAALLLAPTIHPWYVLWVLPWAILAGAWPVVLFSALIPVTAVHAARGEPVGAIVYLIEFVPLAAWTLWRLRRRRGGERPTGPGDPA